MGGAVDLEWERRSAAELDWIWVRRWFEFRLEEKKLESGAADLRLWVRHQVGLKFMGAPLSGSSTVGMGLFSSCLVRLEEKKLERQMWDRVGRRWDRAGTWDRVGRRWDRAGTWDRVGRRRDRAREKRRWMLIRYFLFCFVFFFLWLIYITYLTGNQYPLKLYEWLRSKQRWINGSDLGRYCTHHFYWGYSRMTHYLNKLYN